MNVLIAQRYEVRIGMIELFWGHLWRTILSGHVFGAVLGAAFGAALPTPSGMGHLGLRGALFGTFAGAIEGSTLGVLCGLPLFTITRASYFPVPADARNYLATAGATCALTSLAILLADWLLHGCPDPNGLTPWRTLDALTPSKTIRPAEPGILTFGTGPLLIATLAMWLAGMGAARWYARARLDDR
jgi:hypothetical protein